MAVKLLITDFDGTLVDTFEANYLAYKEAFESVGRNLSRNDYRACFGFRFDRFMDEMGITDSEEKAAIRAKKASVYPHYFSHLKVNRPLLEFIRAFHRAGGKTAVASTARAKNLNNALAFIGATDDFDLILAGENVKAGKPSPEIYQTALNQIEVTASEALVFEDSSVGFAAAAAAGINHIAITPQFF